MLTWYLCLSPPFSQVGVKQDGKSENQWPMWNDYSTARLYLYCKQEKMLMPAEKRWNQGETRLERIAFMALDSTLHVWCKARRREKAGIHTTASRVMAPRISCCQKTQWTVGYPVDWSLIYGWKINQNFIENKNNMLWIPDPFHAPFWGKKNNQKKPPTNHKTNTRNKKAKKKTPPKTQPKVLQ